MYTLDNKEIMQKTIERFLIKANKIHNNKYKYDLTNFKGMQSNIIAICPIHGEFEINCHNHCRPDGNIRCGCKKCKNDLNRKYKENKFLEFCYNNYPQFDYSKINYINETTKVEIICKIHGSFFVTPYLFRQGVNCKFCKQRNWTYTINEFIECANKKHKNKYDYSLITDIKSIKHKQKIICPIHGIFEQSLFNHLQGQGCPYCNHKSKPWEENDVKNKIIEIYGDVFTFEKFKYINRNCNFILTCKKHGDFETNFTKLIDRQMGCPNCRIEKHKNEKIKEFISECKKYYGNLYDYSKSKWYNDEENKRIIVTCKEHGDFYVNPKYHKIGKNVCPECSKTNKFHICEKILFNKLSEKFPLFEFKYNYFNSKILGKQQIDIFSEKYNIGIEYQGEQHFNLHKFNNNSNEKLNKQIERDKIKIEKCKNNNIKLYHFTYLKNINYNNIDYDIINDENILFNKLDEIYKKILGN